MCRLMERRLHVGEKKGNIWRVWKLSVRTVSCSVVWACYNSKVMTSQTVETLLLIAKRSLTRNRDICWYVNIVSICQRQPSFSYFHLEVLFKIKNKIIRGLYSTVPSFIFSSNFREMWFLIKLSGMFRHNTGTSLDLGTFFMLLGFVG